MSYNFKKFKRVKDFYTGCSVGRNLYVSSSLYSEMGEPTFAEVHYDEENLAILIIPKEERENRETYMVSRHQEDKSNRPSGTIGCDVENIGLKKGRYIFEEKYEGGYLCVWKEYHVRVKTPLVLKS